ncbi:peptide-methionine (S)-S-oxide reductase MsrA [Corynebacterium sp. ES2794-CONJ1]|uniref:peptide-methionine (S)-S-oxide reductase MsrA n=1 Tax=unclassified Corynebacterium TaxID=2624378 RepID=UPI00216B447A|nr:MULTISPECIES: peptide-methionine (S)-S-oxide reductase MsrA [unclassified Corynebacterium]MCS4532215.1 peptide-methionine (S)-S-oxide reductase MsrA [Corynebacterium sp. ES2730-CONJ]MCU9519611.1 peptide-methionine (S)-S-oxide reductase MsrA [Corynebacterium sp. ES2794-CONJ1]
MGFLFSKPQSLVAEETALKGGNHPVLPNPKQHYVLHTPITGTWQDTQEVVYVALGCFWGAEKLFWETPGVVSTAVGYAGGVSTHPTYREVCTGRTNHTEVVQVVFDPAVISFDDIIVKAMEAHDPTQGFRQGNDVGTQYRSAIYTRTPEQAARAREIVEAYAVRLKAAGYGDVTTEIKPLTSTPAATFFFAEDEHQQYLAKNPSGYCPHHSTGVACSLES